MHNIKLLLEYDGARYAGWQRQENARSIQGEIESVLEKILQEKVNVIGAGRTDAGVHARGQAANFRTETKLSTEQIKGGLHGLLPEDIVVHSVEDVPADFHARYSAKGRAYSYLITRIPSALERNHSWYVKYPLDERILRNCAEHISGTHDFESFCKANADVQHHRCTVQVSSWTIHENRLRYDIHARILGNIASASGVMISVSKSF